jgi:hypothetical protein
MLKPCVSGLSARITQPYLSMGNLHGRGCATCCCGTHWRQLRAVLHRAPVACKPSLIISSMQPPQPSPEADISSGMLECAGFLCCKNGGDPCRLCCKNGGDPCCLCCKNGGDPCRLCCKNGGDPCRLCCKNGGDPCRLHERPSASSDNRMTAWATNNPRTTKSAKAGLLPV